MKSFKRTTTISKRSPGILLRVPRRCTNGREEVFHRGFIAIEQLAVEVTWVPIDYHPPQVEDCGTIFCHCKYILSFLREPSIMSVSRTKRNSFRARPVRGHRHDGRCRHDRQRQTPHSELTCNACGHGRILFTGPIFSELRLLASSLLDILPIPRFNVSIA